MNSRTTIAAAVGLALVAGLVLGAWWAVSVRPPAFCEISGRSIHANMHTLARVDGDKLHACCPRCPLTLAAQTGKPVELIQVTDYASGSRLAAADAWFVAGSRVEMCASPQVKYDAAHTPYARVFDRCTPSLVAFAREQDARAFMAKFGGSLKRLDEVMAEGKRMRAQAGVERND